MLTEVMTNATNRGQIIPWGLVSVLIVFSLRLPEDDLARMMREVLSASGVLRYGGWGLAGMAAALWAVERRIRRRDQAAEVRRLAQERNFWQSRFLGDKMESSEPEEGEERE